MFAGFQTGATYVGSGRVLLKTRNGFKMYVDSRDISIAPSSSTASGRSGRAVLRQLVAPGMHVLEAGANVGYFTLVMARRRRRGKVDSFECDPQACDAGARQHRDQRQRRTARRRKGARRASGVPFCNTDRHRGRRLDRPRARANPAQSDRSAQRTRRRDDEHRRMEETGIQLDVLKLDAEERRSRRFAARARCSPPRGRSPSSWNSSRASSEKPAMIGRAAALAARTALRAGRDRRAPAPHCSRHRRGLGGAREFRAGVAARVTLKVWALFVRANELHLPDIAWPAYARGSSTTPAARNAGALAWRAHALVREAP